MTPIVRCGVALAHLDRYSGGIGDLSIELKLRKDDPKLIHERGYLEENGGRKDDAIPDYARAGLIFADARSRAAASECIAHLDGLGAKAESGAIKVKSEPKRAKSDLP